MAILLIGTFTMLMAACGGGGGPQPVTSAPINVSPSAPAGLTATATSSTQIDLAWAASTDNVGVSNYRVERCEGTGCVNFVQIGTAPGTVTSYTDSSGLVAGTSYRYQVRSEDAAGNLSGYSNIASESTPSTVAVSCTPGTDCYCDNVKGGSLNDPLLLLCEDFESPSLTQNVTVGTGPPGYGPWYDDTGQTGNRGINSYWNKRYGNAIGDLLFAQGQPVSPTLGSPCALGLCTGMKVWDRANRWSANDYNPGIAFLTQASDFNYEVPSLTVPTNASGGGSGVFDGNTSLAYRIAVGDTHGITGTASFPVTTEIGMTMAMAYPVNSLASGVWGTDAVPAAWKHNEFVTVNSPNCGYDGLFAFYNQIGPREGRPFAGFIGAFGLNCTGNGYNGSITNISAGNAELIDQGLGVYWNAPANYDQATDWPEGTWGCVRGHLIISGGVERYRVWFQGPNDRSERLLIDITFTSARLDNEGGYNGMKWNAYANTNSGTQSYVPSTALTYRYEDNVHLRAGPPVSCAQIGFI